jgi:HAMP domain-containing protein
MRIRTKLVGYFLVIAMFVPLLGGAALSRIRSIDHSVQNLSDNAIPRIGDAQELAALQRDQQAAALAYVAGGKAEDRQTYLDLGPKFDQQLAALNASGSAGGKDKQQAISAARAKFTNAGAQLVTSRTTRDRNLDNLHAKHDDIVQKLNSIRARFVSGGQNPTDASGVPQAVRYQINDLLLGTEGMLHMVALEQSLASDYTITPDDKLRQQFDSASNSFNGWLQIAYNAGGGDDRAILTQIQNDIGQFESSARAMMAAADLSAKSLDSFVAASREVQDALNAYVTYESGELAVVKKSSAGAVSSAQSVVISLTLLGFAFAGAVGFWLASSITRPIRRLRDVADRVSTGDLQDVDISVDTRDEIGDLADAFRRMVVSIRFLMTGGRDDDAEDEDLDFAAAS